jgi:hypothetical protein
MRRAPTFCGLGLLGFIALSIIALTGASAAAAAVHDVAATKSCVTPVRVGDPYTCSGTIANTADTGQDTVRVSGLSDTVHAAGGDVSGSFLSSVGLIFTGPVTCVGGFGLGTTASPYVGAVECLLPFGSSIQTTQFSHHTVQPGDFFLPANTLTDSLSWNWNNTCVSDPDGDCTTTPQTKTVGGSATVMQLSSSTTTEIHNAAHQMVTTVTAGATVHDFVTVAGQPASPSPSGNFVLQFFTNSGCTGLPAATSDVLVLNASGQADAVGFPQGPLAAGFYAFQATYQGDATYTGSVGPCEALQVVDANIQLTPPNATNQVGTNHVLTCHVNVNDGSGFTSAPAGTTCTGSIVSGPGSFVGSNQCTTVGTTGDCQLTITSNATGQTVVRASTNVSVGGAIVTRSTGDANPGDSPDAQKQWVNAAIVIAPNATNEVGQPHTFTVTVLADTGAGLQPVGAGVPCNVTLTGASGASPVPAGPFNLTTNAAGQCSVTFTSATAGTVTGTASSTVTINGTPINVSTNGQAPNSSPAVKTFVDANIQLTPASSSNPTGTNHVLTCHINVNDGSGGYTNAPAGTACTGSIQSGPGSFVGSNQCTTVGTTGDCQLTITSNSPGTTTVRATTTVSVGGVVVTRTTGDTLAGDSPDARKEWILPQPVVTVVKACPNGKQSDADRFGVVLNGTPTGDVLDCGGQATVNPSSGASYSIRERAASTTTNLANYAVTYSAGCDGSLPTGGTATCTITNTRNTPRSQPFTPGYWKNHLVATAALLPVQLGAFVVGDAQTARAVFDAMNCSNSSDANAIGCLAGHLLAAKLNVKNGAGNCINPVINAADALLLTVGYSGPSVPLASPPTPAQRALALQLQAALDKYNNGKGC